MPSHNATIQIRLSVALGQLAGDCNVHISTQLGFPAVTMWEMTSNLMTKVMGLHPTDFHERLNGIFNNEEL